MSSETIAYTGLLCGHLAGFTTGLRKLPAEQWDWTPHIAAPTARILATHAWQWLQCDRQHINTPDASQHTRIPDPPTEPSAMCDALDRENAAWKDMISRMTPEFLDEKRSQFNQNEMTVRDFICHMIQNTIYKHGQFTTLFFALEHDGSEVYAAPFPNPIYEELFGPRTPEPPDITETDPSCRGE